MLAGCLGIEVSDPLVHTQTGDASSSEDSSAGSLGGESPGTSGEGSEPSGTPEEGDDTGAEGPDEAPPVLRDLPPEPPGGPLAGFEERALELGIEAFHDRESNTFSTPGIAWGDYDEDGYLDLVLTSQAQPNRAFVGGPGGVFVEASWAEDVALAEQVSSGVVAADYDNDGWLDLYVLADGPNSLLRNLEGTGFEERAELAGVATKGMGEGANFVDFDDDGDLDLYVANNNFFPPDYLYRNDGEGSFEDVSQLLTFEARARPAFSSSWFDYDLDGDVDLYVVNDKHAGNVLWRNDGPGCGYWCFTDVSDESGAALQMWSMGLALGDYDNDGDTDVFVTNIGEAALLENLSAQGEPSFVERAEHAGVLIDDDGWGDLGWGAQFVDFDNDGWLDLYVAVGKWDPGPSQPNCLLRNNGDGTFTKLEDAGGASEPNVSYALAQADFDDDGWVDLLVGNPGQRYSLFHNQGSGNHYLEIVLVSEDPAVNRDAVGSRITVHDSLGRMHRRELVVGSSLGAGSSLRLHVGLGDAMPVSARVEWPNGEQELFEQLPVDSTWAVVKQ